MSRFLSLVCALLAIAALPVVASDDLETSPRPKMRKAPDIEAVQVAFLTERRPPRTRPAHLEALTPASQTGLDAWITAFRPRALSAGIASSVFDDAMRGVQYLPDVIRRDRNQSEFTKTIWDYLDTAVSDTRIANGKAALRRQGDILRRVEAVYGVDHEIVTAIWGLESAYGAFRGETSTLSALATLAFDGRRGDFFESQLLATLRILQSGDTRAINLQGSWAGAMGHTQFMPTSYLDYAEDFTGDGRRDIWGDDPTDALASTARYLRDFGWKKGQPWGVEVQLPQGFDYTRARRDNTRLPSQWARDGIVDVNGKPVPDHGPASVLLPAGAQGAAFLIFDNFEVLERYNTADAYVIGVGHLADRLAGGGPIRASWPRGDRALTLPERLELQERLTAAGFDPQKIDGKIGPLTINAVRSYQKSIGLVPDGYVSLRVLQSLRGR